MNHPVACTLSLSELRARAGDLLPGLVRRADLVEVVENGVRLRFAGSPDDPLGAIVKVIDAERQCCRFLRFDLRIESVDDPVWLTVTGPAGTREFLSELLAE